MNKLPGRLMTVMFNPLDYIHPTRFRLPQQCGLPAQRAAINAMLLDHYQLRPLPLPRLTAGLDAVLKHWRRLPDITLLLGATHLRLALARRGAVLRLPLWVQEFLRLPLPGGYAPRLQATRDVEAGIPDLFLLSWHGVQLLDVLTGGVADGPADGPADGLPAALKMRIPLLFAASYDAAAAAATAADTHPVAVADTGWAQQSMLLAMAIQHVKRRDNHG